MDLYRIIDELTKERDHVSRIIESLESVTANKNAAPKRRGRKSMDHAARAEVSERMRRYWARRRQERAMAGGVVSGVDFQPARSASAGMGNAA